MKTNFKNLIFIFAVLFFLVLGCDSWTNLNGKVTDEDGKPVAAAQVIVEQGSSKVAEEKSGGGGYFDIFGNLTPLPFAGSVKLTIKKEGYETYEKYLSQEELDRHKIDVILKKK